MVAVRLKGKSYEIIATLGYNLSGKKISRTVYFTPDNGMSRKEIKRELERQKKLAEESAKDWKLLNSQITFSEFAEMWFNEYAEQQLKKKTVAGYRELIKRINKAIGHMELETLQPHHIMSFYVSLSESGVRTDIKYKPVPDFYELLKSKGISKVKLAELSHLSLTVVNSCTSGRNITAKSAAQISEVLGLDAESLFTPEDKEKILSPLTVLHYHRLISSILNKAVKCKAIQSNPCDKIELPKLEDSELKYLSEAEAARLLSLVEDQPMQFKTIIKLLLYTGIRRAELCGLEWGDINFEKRTIRIARTSLYVPDAGIYNDSVKSYASNRNVKVTDAVVEMLRAYRKWQDEQKTAVGSLWGNSGKVFTSWSGKPIHPDTITKHFSDFNKKHGLPDITIQALRHTYATLLIASGTPLATVQKRLGYTKNTKTESLYISMNKSPGSNPPLKDETRSG